jgi:hypothetical protein
MDSEGAAFPLPSKPAVPPSDTDSDSSLSSSWLSSTASLAPLSPRTPPRLVPALALLRMLPQNTAPGPPSAPRPTARIAPWPGLPKRSLLAPTRPAPSARAPAPVPAPAPAAKAPELVGPHRSARSNAVVEPPVDWYNTTVRMQGKVRGVPVSLVLTHGLQHPCASHLPVSPAPLLQYQVLRRRRMQHLRPHANHLPTRTTTRTYTRNSRRAWHTDWHWTELLSLLLTSAHFFINPGGLAGAGAADNGVRTSTDSATRLLAPGL